MKTKKSYDNMSIEELEKEVAVCKKQEKGYRIGKLIASAFTAIAVGSGAGLLIRGIVNTINRNDQVANLIELPKQEYVMEEVGNLYNEMRQDANLTPEKKEFYLSQIEGLINLSNNDFIQNNASPQLKAEVDEVYSQYHTLDYAIAGVGVAVGGTAITLPIAYALYRKETNKYGEGLHINNQIADKYAEEQRKSIKYSPTVEVEDKNEQ